LRCRIGEKVCRVRFEFDVRRLDRPPNRARFVPPPALAEGNRIPSRWGVICRAAQPSAGDLVGAVEAADYVGADTDHIGRIRHIEDFDCSLKLPRCIFRSVIFVLLIRSSVPTPVIVPLNTSQKQVTESSPRYRHPPGIPGVAKRTSGSFEKYFGPRRDIWSIAFPRLSLYPLPIRPRGWPALDCLSLVCSHDYVG